MSQGSAAVAEDEYLPFGGSRTRSGSSVTAYLFTDQEFDASSGLYNYDARLYDPQALSRYSYCRNNPLIFVDPSGHWNIDVDGGGRGNDTDVDNPRWSSNPVQNEMIKGTIALGEAIRKEEENRRQQEAAYYYDPDPDTLAGWLAKNFVDPYHQSLEHPIARAVVGLGTSENIGVAS